MVEVGGYYLEAEIGAGSSGTVWKAFRGSSNPQPVALKRLHAAGRAVDLQRMRREAAVLAKLDHPHIVRVIEILEDGAGIAVAMQYAPGGSLAALLEERGNLTAGEVVAVTAPLASALASAHRHGVVHGDVKPANILFTSDGEPLLADFGSVRTIGRLTSETFASTPEYVAPELLDGATPDARVDVYSLAVVCYYALTGKPPYTGGSLLAVVRAADLGVYDTVRRRPEVPEALAEVIERGMARDPGQRFASAEELRQGLSAAVPPDQVRLPRVPDWSLPGDDGDSSVTVVFGPRPRPELEPESVQQPKRAPRSAILVAVALAIGLVTFGAIWPLQALLESEDAANTDSQVTIPSSVPPAEAAPDLEPTGLVADDFGDTVDLHWADNSEGRLAYVVLYRAPGQDQQVVEVDGGATSVSVRGLDPELSYCFRVLGVGLSPAEEMVRVWADTSVRGCDAGVGSDP